MSLTINHNQMAMNAARNLGAAYGNLSTSIQRMSSGLRINNASDDAAGLAIREMMRADVATMQQGLRNAADAISLIQTADGALAVIDEKLIRMKELAEQAATGTYTTAQRDIINSEYQAMAREIDRIANSSNFNGIKLLDGSISNQHGGQGLKIHFGTGNSAAEDYYFINIGDARATSKTGLRVGGDSKNDVWGQGAAGAGEMGGQGCCTAGFDSLNGVAGFKDGQSFSYGYNWDWKEDNDVDLLSGRYLAGRYTVSSAESLQDLIDKVNAGTQSRVGVRLDNTSGQAAGLIALGGGLAVCVGDEAYVWGDMAMAQGGSGMVAYHTYKSELKNIDGRDMFSNFANTFLTDNSGLAAALGMTTASIETEIRNAPTDQAALDILNNMVYRMNQGTQFITANSASAAVRGFDLTTAHGQQDLAMSYLKQYIETESNSMAANSEALDAVNLFKQLHSKNAIALSAGGMTLSAGIATAIGESIYVPDGNVPNSWETDIFYNICTKAWTTNTQLTSWLKETEDAALWKQVSFTETQLKAALAATSATAVFNESNFGLAVATFLGKSAGSSTSAVVGGLGLAARETNDFDIAQDSTIQFWAHVSAGATENCTESLWTANPGVAGPIGLTQASFSGTTTGNAGGMSILQNLTGLELNGVTVSPALLAKLNVEATGTTVNLPEDGIKTGIYASSTYWTDNKILGEALGLSQVTLYGTSLSALATEIDTKLNRALASEIEGTILKHSPGNIANLTLQNVQDGHYVDNREEKIQGYVDPSKNMTLVGDGTGGYFNAHSLASAINNNADSKFWAMLSSGNNQVYVFSKEGGDHNEILSCEATGIDESSRRLAEYVDFQNVETGLYHSSGTNLSLGTTAANSWGKLTPQQTGTSKGLETWNVTLSGRDTGNQRDLWIAAAGELKLPGVDESIINGLDRYSFVELQNASDGAWAGADIRTQSNAQAALAALDDSINIKDKVRADLGALQNRLENTMTALEIQSENLQASESRISDVDVAKEMTAFTRNNVMVQAAVGMLAQANSMSQLALSLVGR